MAEQITVNIRVPLSAEEITEQWINDVARDYKQDKNGTLAKYKIVLEKPDDLNLDLTNEEVDAIAYAFKNRTILGVTIAKEEKLVQFLGMCG